MQRKNREKVSTCLSWLPSLKGFIKKMLVKVGRDKSCSPTICSILKGTLRLLIFLKKDYLMSGLQIQRECEVLKKRN